MLLALVDAEYRFFWFKWIFIRCTYFNRSHLKEKIEDSTLGLLAPEPLGEGGPNLHYFLSGDNVFELIPRMVKLYSRKQLTREERIASYRISKVRRVMVNVFGILVSRFRVLLCTMEQRPRVVRDIILHVWCYKTC